MTQPRILCLAVACTLSVSAKPPLRGLVSSNGLPPAGWEDVVKFAVCAVKWQEIEPAPGQYRFARIDAFLAAAGRRHIGVYLRIFAGRDSPDWLKASAGTVSMNDRFDSIQADVVRWWAPAAGKAYANLQRALAARYDRDPRFIAVTISRCSSIWAEPLMRQLNDKPTRDALWNAGLRADADKALQIDAVKMHAEIWRETYSSLALNPYQAIEDSAKGWKQNPDFTIELIREATRLLGGRLLLQNNSLRDAPPPPASPYGSICAAMRSSGAPVGFQTIGNQRIRDLKNTVEIGIALGASYFEVYGYAQPSAYNKMTKADLVELNRRLEGNR
jgi:hypothetical protein